MCLIGYLPTVLLAAGVVLGGRLMAQQPKRQPTSPPAAQAEAEKENRPTAPQVEWAASKAVTSDSKQPEAEQADAGEAHPKQPGAEQADAEQLFQAGRDALFRSQFQQAIALLEKAVKAQPERTNYRLHLARAYRYAGKQAEAEKTLEAILATAADHVDAGQLLAEIYSESSRWDDVVRVLAPLLEYRHDYPTYHMLAEAEYQRGNTEQARKYYEKAVALNPQSAPDHYQLGNIYLAENLFALAAEAYEKAAALGIDTPVLHYKLASAYFNLRNYFGRITVREVKSGKAGTISGSSYLIEPVPGSTDLFRCAPERSAAYQVAKALAEGIQPQPNIFILQAAIYLSGRRYQKAYEMFREIEPQVPKENKALFYYYQAQAALGIGRYDEYLDLLRRAIDLDPEGYRATLVDGLVEVAEHYNQAGDLDKYIEHLRLAVAESPHVASLHLKLGYAYQEAQQYDKAAEQWRMVLDLEPDHPQRTTLLNLITRYRTSASAGEDGSGKSAPATSEQ